MTHSGVLAQLVTTLKSPTLGNETPAASNDHTNPADARFLPANTSCASSSALGWLSSK